MKLINRPKFEHPATCGKCKTEVVVEKDDFTIGENTYGYAPPTPYRLYWACPQCGTVTNVYEHDIQEEWADYLAAKAELPSRDEIRGGWRGQHEARMRDLKVRLEERSIEAANRPAPRKILDWLKR